MKMSRAEKLKGMKMPKPSGESDAEQDLVLEELDALEDGGETPTGTWVGSPSEDGEDPDTLRSEEGMEGMEGGMLEEYSDDELLEELKARGLSDMGMEEDEEGELIEEEPEGLEI